MDIALAQPRERENHSATESNPAGGGGGERAGGPFLLFIHGGAWGSGAREHYATFCSNLSGHTGCAVASSSYRVFPAGLVGDMAQDVGDAARACEPGSVIIGHSAGAHLVALAALTGLIDSRVPGGGSVGRRRLVLMSGIFCIHSHFMFEAGRGVERLSPMERAMGGKAEFARHSPLKLLEGGAEEVRERARGFEWVLLHGAEDWTAPWWESQRFFKALEASGAKAKLVLLEKVGHSDMVMAVMRKSHTHANLIKSAIQAAAVGPL